MDVRLEAEFFPNWLKCISYVKICKKKNDGSGSKSASPYLLLFWSNFFQTKTIVIYVKI